MVNNATCDGCKVKQTECVGYHKKLVSKYEGIALENKVKLEEYKAKVQKCINRIETLESNLGFGGTLQTMYADTKLDEAIEIIKDEMEVSE